MTDDILARATRALRESTDPDPSANGEPTSSARFTRARVMASLHQRTVRRRTRAAFLLPIAATLGTVSAWGAASGKAPEIWDVVTRKLGLEAAPPAPPPAPLERSARTLRRPAEVAVKRGTAPEPEPAPAPTVSAPAAPEPAVAVVPAAPAASSSTRAALPDPAHELYRRAHSAHFAQHDPARALALWDEYLRAAPRGRFAVEARYNRALCLVRLGRRAEARAALEPFASGKFGGYRQSEAAELVDALGD